MLHQGLLLLHLLGGMAWVGGMFFAYVCLRPSAAEVLEPPQRLTLWLATLSRFLNCMSLAVPTVLGSGLGLWLGRSGAPIGWHVMAFLGVSMAGVYGLIHVGLLPRLRAHCAAQAWPAAAQVLNTIRRLVALNLTLGLLAVLAAVSARY